MKLQRKIAAYRQMQHDTTGQLYSVAAGVKGFLQTVREMLPSR